MPEADAFAIQAHNQYVELLTVFGAVAVVVILPIVVLTLVRLIRLRLKTGNDIYEIVAIAYLMLLVSALFANGKFYQPTSASVLFLAMFASTSTVLGGVHPTISSRVSESSGSDSPNLDGARGTPGRHRRGVEKSGAGDR